MNDPVRAYKLIGERQKNNLNILYLSLPHRFKKIEHHLGDLQKLTPTKIVLIDEAVLVQKIVNSLNSYGFDSILSVSKRGEDVCKSLCSFIPHLSSIPRQNVKINRSNLEKPNLQPVAGKKILIIDDIFCTGSTLDRIISLLDNHTHISCAFLFGPDKLIQEFQKRHINVNIIYADKITEDPRFDNVDFTDFETLLELITSYGVDAKILKRTFQINSAKAMKLIQSMYS